MYLHQVVERGRSFTRYLDLPQALEAVALGAGELREWRIHFHVPIFCEKLGIFRNTQDYLRELLAILRHQPVSQHLEVETYTWNVLPEEHRREDIVTAVAREIEWVTERLTS